MNSLLPKFDELREIVKISNTTVTGSTETKFDNSIGDSEISIDGYCGIRKSTLGEENKNIIKGENKVSSETKRYLEFCKTFGLKQIIKSPTRVTPSTSNLADHILTNTNEKNTQCGLVNIWLSDHQMIFCTRKIEKEKVGGHKQISFRSSENYSVDKYKIS